MFETDDILTYEFISACLGQRPPLQHFPESKNSNIIDFQPLANTEPVSISGGTYEATYIFEGKKVGVTFIKDNNDYIALTVSLSLIED